MEFFDFVRSVVASTVLESTIIFGYTSIFEDVDQSTINNGRVVVYHRTSSHPEDFTDGFVDPRGQEGYSRNGQLYGNGVYCNYSLEDSQKNHTYGRYILKVSVKPGKCIIYDMDLAKAKFGEQCTILDQFKKYGLLSKVDKAGLEKINRADSMLHNHLSSGAAYLLHEYTTKLADSIIFTGQHDGRVLVSYNFNVTVLSAFDTEKKESIKLNPTIDVNASINSSKSSSVKGEKVFESSEYVVVYYGFEDGDADLKEKYIVRSKSNKSEWVLNIRDGVRRGENTVSMTELPVDVWKSIYDREGRSGLLAFVSSELSDVNRLDLDCDYSIYAQLIHMLDFGSDEHSFVKFVAKAIEYNNLNAIKILEHVNGFSDALSLALFNIQTHLGEYVGGYGSESLPTFRYLMNSDWCRDDSDMVGMFRSMAGNMIVMSSSDIPTVIAMMYALAESGRLNVEDERLDKLLINALKNAPDYPFFDKVIYLMVNNLDLINFDRDTLKTFCAQYESTRYSDLVTNAYEYIKQYLTNT